MHRHIHISIGMCFHAMEERHPFERYMVEWLRDNQLSFLARGQNDVIDYILLFLTPKLCICFITGHHDFVSFLRLTRTCHILSFFSRQSLEKQLEAVLPPFLHYSWAEQLIDYYSRPQCKCSTCQNMCIAFRGITSLHSPKTSFIGSYISSILIKDAE